MRLGRWFGISVRLSPLALPMMLLALWLGEGRRMLVMSASILLHEMMHAAAARLLRVRVIELELMPCGGAVRLENLWRLRPRQTALVALAGPAANVLLAVCAAALCWWGVLEGEWAALVIEQNAVIFAFNMLPALPMDGGRILCGLLSRRFSPGGAARIGMYIASVLAAGLLVLSMFGLRRGRLNITLPMAALFLLVSARRERAQAECAALESLSGRWAELEAETVLPMRWLAVRKDTTVREAAACLRPRYMYMLAVYDERMRLCSVIEEGVMTGALLHDADTQMEKLEGIVKSKKVEKRC